MFGFGGNNSNARMPKTPRTIISPNESYGYSNVFIDDADRMLLEWEFNGAIPTQEMVERARETAEKRLEAANFSDEMKEHLSTLSDSNARIIGNLTSTKSKVAQGSKRQYDAWSRHFGNMDALSKRYELSKSRRDYKLTDINETFDCAVANLRVNSVRRRKQRAEKLEKFVTKAEKPIKKKKKRKKVTA